MKIKSSLRMGILGKTGGGKTVLLKKIIKEFCKKIPIIIFDIKHDYIEYPEVPSLDKINWDAKKGVIRYKYRGSFEDFERFCQKVWFNLTKDKSRRVILVFDEIALIMENESLKHFPYFKKLLLMGRSYGIGMWFATQRPALLNKTILSQCRYKVMFSFDSQLDLDAIKPYLEPSIISNLKDYWYCEKEDGKDPVVNPPIK